MSDRATTTVLQQRATLLAGDIQRAVATLSSDEFVAFQAALAGHATAEHLEVLERVVGRLRSREP